MNFEEKCFQITFKGNNSVPVTIIKRCRVPNGSSRKLHLITSRTILMQINNQQKSDVNRFFGWFVFLYFYGPVPLVCMVKNIRLSCNLLWKCRPVFVFIDIVFSHSHRCIYTSTQTCWRDRFISLQLECRCYPAAQQSKDNAKRHIFTVTGWSAARLLVPCGRIWRNL